MGCSNGRCYENSIGVDGTRTTRNVKNMSFTYMSRYVYIQGGPKKHNTESMSNIHNKLNTCISSKCKSLWTIIGRSLLYLSAVISLNNYLISLHGIKFVPKIALVSLSFWLVSVLFFGPPCICIYICTYFVDCRWRIPLYFAICCNVPGPSAISGNSLLIALNMGWTSSLTIVNGI